MPASGAPDSPSGVMPTTIPALALRSLREYWLMPLVTRGRLGGGRHHGAARTHAEAVDRAAVAGVVHQLVIGGAERGCPAPSAEARAVDQRLRMLDAEADGEGLGLDGDAARRACGTCRGRCGPAPAPHDRPQCLAAGQHHAAHLPAPSGYRSQVVDLAFEAVLAAQRFDGLRACFPPCVTSRKVPMCGLAT